MVITFKTLSQYLTFSLLLGWLCTNTVAQPLNVVTENWPPYNYQSPSGEIHGIATDNVREILALTDLSYQIRVNPWARSLHLAKTKPNTLIYSIYRSAEREPYFQLVFVQYLQIRRFTFIAWQAITSGLAHWRIFWTISCVLA